MPAAPTWQPDNGTSCNGSSFSKHSNSILQASAEWPESAFQHFVADYLVSFWNVTMQNSVLRILMPLVLVAMSLKVGSMLIDKLLKAEGTF